MSSLPSLLPPMHRRFLSSAIFAFALLPVLPQLANAQAAVPTPATQAGSQGTDTGASAPINNGGGRGGRGGRNNGGAAGFGTGGFGTGGGGRGQGRGGRGQFGAAGAAGAAGTDTIPTIVTPAGAGNPGANPNVPGGAFNPNGGPGFGGPGGYRAITGETPDYNELVDVQMNGQGAPEVLDWLQRNTGKIILQSQTLPQVRIIYSTHAGPNNSLPRKVVIDNIISLLALNKILITEVDEHTLKAETSDGTNPGRGLTEADDAKLAGPPSEMIYTHIFPIVNTTADDAVTHIGPFLSSTATALALPKTNSIFVADSLINLQHVAEALKMIDSKVSTQQEITIHVMTNARATDVASNLTALQTGILAPWFGPAGGQPTTLFAADARTNSMIIITNKSNHDMVTQLLDQYDSDVPSSTKTQVFSLRQSLANDMRTLLQSIVTGVQQTTGARGGAGAGGAGGGAAPVGASASRDQQFSQYVTIAADTRSNSVVAFGTPSDLRQIGDLIDRVDILLPQARIEAIITEVTLSKNDTTGLSAFGINYGGFVPGNGTTAAALNGGPGNKNYTAGVGTNGNVFSINGTLTNWDLNTVFGVARSNSNVVILSNPFVTATHAQQSSINDGQRVPTIGSSTTNPTAGNAITNTVTYLNVSVTLSVTPFIGKDGSISMNITQNVDSVQGNVTINGVANPIIGNRTVTSNVTVHDGDVLVLGGMRKRSVSQTHGVMFLLGEIPIVGQLFQPDENDSTTTELIIFIKPTIIKDTSNTTAMLNEIAENSQSGDIAMRYMRNHDLSMAGADIHNPNIKPGAPAGPSPEHSPQTPAPAASTPSATLNPVQGSTNTSTNTTPTAPPPVSSTGDATPAAVPPSSSKPIPTVQGFNK